MVASLVLPAPTNAGLDALRPWLDRFGRCHLDLGTGDGAYALHLARTEPSCAVVGVDTCLANLAKPARRGGDNLRLLAADATALPAWLLARTGTVTVNFPFGKLLRAVAGAEDVSLFAALPADTRIEIRVNESAADAEAIPFADVVAGVRRTLAGRDARLAVVPVAELRAFPSTWAKRLGHGRPARALVATTR